jgi:foldase protein PrsA
MVASQGGMRGKSRRATLLRLLAIGIGILATAAALLAGSGCSGESQGPVAVRIGDVSIGSSAVNHWAAAIRLGNTVGASLGKHPGTPRERALAFLISANWLIGEAAEEGLAASEAAVERKLKQRMESVPGGRAEFEEELASTGQTTDDVKLEIKAELAANALRDVVLSQVPIVTPQQGIIDYYHRHIERYRVPERRIADLIESIDTRAQAVALGRRLGAGARFAKRALHESVARQTPAEAAASPYNAELVRGIFAATPGKVSSPARFNGGWVLIVVRGRVPGRTKGLKEVEVGIQNQLRAEKRRELFAEFEQHLRDTWMARTDCRPGFVVQKCSQYHGALKSEEALVLDGP